MGGREDTTVRRFTEERGVPVLPSLLTGSGWLNHQLLANPATSQRFLEQIVAYVEEQGYQGIDLDLEGIKDEDRGAFSDFVARVAAALHARGKLLTLAIPAKSADVRTGWAGPYDYAELGKHADLILLMTYDYHWAGGEPGSIAPVSWVDKVAAYAKSQIPAAKVLLGVAFYAYDWNLSQGGKARAWTYPQAAALAEQYSAQVTFDAAEGSATFKYTARAGLPRPDGAATGLDRRARVHDSSPGRLRRQGARGADDYPGAHARAGAAAGGLARRRGQRGGQTGDRHAPRPRWRGRLASGSGGPSQSGSH